ncbi:MAG: N-formylglutamate amidohydrolase [Rhizobiaceae bacterium]
MQQTTDPIPFIAIDGDYAAGMLLLADHARNALPPEYGTLGLAQSEFERHIAYDIGVEAVTRGIAARLGVPAVLCGFSRLLIDPNRGEDDPTLIRQLYDGAVIAGNYPLDPLERERRLDGWYRPYHREVAGAVDKVARASGLAPLLISIHSFTPTMQGVARPWHVSLLWDIDDRAMRPLYEALTRDGEFVVGDNEPYDGALKGDTMYRHAMHDGYPHVLIEIRQDLVATAEGQAEWADRLAPVLDGINAQADIHHKRFFGSRTHG